MKIEIMSQPVRLSITKPCHEKWDDFTPTATGGFCSSCSKNVIDFTKMTETEIVEFIKTKPSNACGRFRQGQLKDYTIARTYDPRIKPSGMLFRAGLISLVMAFINKPATAQVTTSAQSVKTEQTLAEKLKSPGKKRTITGIVRDNDSIPMPGVNVVVAGTLNGTVTNIDGRFELPQQVEDGQAMVFSFIGYLTYTHYVGFLKDDYLQVQLNPDNLTLGGLVMMGEPMIQEAPKQNLFDIVRKWFK